MDLREYVNSLIQQLSPEHLSAVKEYIWQLNVGLDLGHIAMNFRSSRDEAARQQAIRDYEEVVDKLIATGHWHEFPAPEDMLPDEYMPAAFNDYWLDENLSRGMPG